MRPGILTFFSLLALIMLAFSVSAVVRDAGDITADTREWTLVLGDTLKFTHKQLYHAITMTSVSTSSARFELDEPVDKFLLYEGESVAVDLNSDDTPDINLTLLKLLPGGAVIEIASYVKTVSTIELLPPAPARTPTRRSDLLKAEEDAAKAAAEPEPVPPVLIEEPVADSEPDTNIRVEEGLGTKLYYYVGIGAVVVIALVVLIGSAVMEKRKKEDEAESVPKAQGKQYPEGLQTPEEKQSQQDIADDASEDSGAEPVNRAGRHTGGETSDKKDPAQQNPEQ
ncbi:MAG: hypothetical protein V1729_04850 [Candidatus Woesearchaeota archaeon]